MERDHLAEMNGDMVVSVAEFLDNAGDDDFRNRWKIYLES